MGGSSGEPSKDTSTHHRKLTIPKNLPENFSELSKNAQKRLLKRMHFEATRSEWKAKKREKKQARKLATSENIQEEQGTASVLNVKSTTTKEPPRGAIIFDMGFNDLMTPTEVASLVCQLSRAYSANRHSSRPFNLVAAGVGGVVAERLQKAFPEHPKWEMSFVHEDVGTLLDRPKVLYLSADADQVLMEVDPDSTLIIGGLVDRNRHKNSALLRAASLGIPSARLPISEHVKLNSSQVLTVLHGKTIDLNRSDRLC